VTKKEQAQTIKFMQHYVTDGTTKAKVFYSQMSRRDGRECIAIYEKAGYQNNLRKIFPANYKNETGSVTDYFEEDKVYIFKEDKLYPVALARYEENATKFDAKYKNKHLSL
jgi:hypothetical protein